MKKNLGHLFPFEGCTVKGRGIATSKDAMVKVGYTKLRFFKLACYIMMNIDPRLPEQKKTRPIICKRLSMADKYERKEVVITETESFSNHVKVLG